MIEFNLKRISSSSSRCYPTHSENGKCGKIVCKPIRQADHYHQPASQQAVNIDLAFRGGRKHKTTRRRRGRKIENITRNNIFSRYNLINCLNKHPECPHPSLRSVGRRTSGYGNGGEVDDRFRIKFIVEWERFFTQLMKDETTRTFLGI